MYYSRKVSNNSIIYAAKLSIVVAITTNYKLIKPVKAIIRYKNGLHYRKPFFELVTLFFR